MKIMWITNTILPEFAEYLGVNAFYGGGWMVSLSRDIVNNSNHELVICSPSKKGDPIRNAVINGITYYSFPQNLNADGWKELSSNINPNIVHIHGTEFDYGLRFLESNSNNIPSVASIQGLVSIYAHHFYANVPCEIVKRRTLAQWAINDSIKKGKENLISRGVNEEQTIKKCGNILGRTRWDKGCVYNISPTANYYYCGESLRDSFYKNKWSLDKCEKHSIFISQATHPIKGFHMFLQALVLIRSSYPDVKVYVTGKNIIASNGKLGFLKKRYYDKYIKKMIKKENLADNIVFLGSLKEHEMMEHMIKCNVFVSPSAIENSPNSLGEAMQLGMPIVSSYVGGTPDLFTHDVEGYFYPYDEFYMLAYYVKTLFSDMEKCNSFSENASKRAVLQYSREKNLSDLLNIYGEVIGKAS